MNVQGYFTQITSVPFVYFICLNFFKRELRNHLLPCEVDVVRQVVVQVGESDFVLCPDRLSNNDLVDVIELVPVLISAGETEESPNISSYLVFVP